MRLNTIGSDYSGSNPFLLLFSRLKGCDNNTGQKIDSQGDLQACLLDSTASYQEDEFTPRSEKYMLLKEKGLIEDEDEGYEKFEVNEDDDDDD